MKNQKEFKKKKKNLTVFKKKRKRKKKKKNHKIHFGFNDDNTENIVFKIVHFKKNALFFIGNNITA